MASELHTDCAFNLVPIKHHQKTCFVWFFAAAHLWLGTICSWISWILWKCKKRKVKFLSISLLPSYAQIINGRKVTRISIYKHVEIFSLAISPDEWCMQCTIKKNWIIDERALQKWNGISFPSNVHELLQALWIILFIFFFLFTLNCLENVHQLLIARSVYLKRLKRLFFLESVQKSPQGHHQTALHIPQIMCV